MVADYGCTPPPPPQRQIRGIELTGHPDKLYVLQGIDAPLVFTSLADLQAMFRALDKSKILKTSLGTGRRPEVIEFDEQEPHVTLTVLEGYKVANQHLAVDCLLEE
jgi:hypothetical protein